MRTGSTWTTMARVERDLTGGITLHLIDDHTVAGLTPGDEFLTVTTVVDPFAPTE